MIGMLGVGIIIGSLLLTMLSSNPFVSMILGSNVVSAMGWYSLNLDKLLALGAWLVMFGWWPESRSVKGIAIISVVSIIIMVVAGVMMSGGLSL